MPSLLIQEPNHYSYALLDCIKSISVPTIEVHLSDLSKRESFRQNSVVLRHVLLRLWANTLKVIMMPSSLL